MKDDKKQLARILLKRRVIVEADLERTLAEGDAEPLASKLIARGLVREADVLRGLSEQYGVPAVDLERIGLATAHLVLPEAFAKKHKVLVLFHDEARVLVAMAAPDDDDLLGEIARATGRTPVAYVALPLPLHRAIDRAYAAARTRQDAYFGRHARTAERPSKLLSLATFLPPPKRTDDAVVFTDDGLRESAEEEALSSRSPDDEPPSTGIDIDGLLEAGALAFQEKRHDDAVANLRKAIRVKPDSFRARYQLSLMLGQLNRLHEATTEMELALSLEPKSYSALKNLALLYEKNGFRGRAVDTWRRALDHAPDEPTRQRVAAHLSKLAS